MSASKQVGVMLTPEEYEVLTSIADESSLSDLGRTLFAEYCAQKGSPFPPRPATATWGGKRENAGRKKREKRKYGSNKESDEAQS